MMLVFAAVDNKQSFLFFKFCFYFQFFLTLLCFSNYFCIFIKVFCDNFFFFSSMFR